MTAAIVFLFILAVLWFFLPFAVFGTKPLLSNILSTQRQILAELRRQNSDGKKTPGADAARAADTVSSPTEIVTCAACGRETYGGMTDCPHCGQPLRIALEIKA